MNAAEQAIGVTVATKIAAVVNLFKSHFPDAKADLRPWANDPDTRQLIDPDSIDIGFHLPGWSRSAQSRSILVQIRFYQDPLLGSRRAIGIEAAGFTHLGEQWRLSTVEDWQFIGKTEPSSEVKEKLKQFCRQVFELFNTTEAA
ncbi:MAG: hypothetical protein EDM05_034365 [Leptolyngbya sp. IPPAS B-1204]|uniref:Uncharacterized protein n=1 Tax=Leptolyngbya sp. NK1-12 TaxID=2547451 RepID=A0AA96WH99_9CYAN|nr:hypothetical protein [Leptolyngbya sp. NK1-12]MBF2047714.1 hypothetical protein [Elainella sp. C42_A2020_010]RNJ65054.1 MAG: hypothetical protein EDM05_33175 [Leptolyngbya sp. IPPAS B-1204]WNZ25478.1 hypothetical protein HJG54_23240 [Leptolyngbya sp. NK1-12]